MVSNLPNALDNLAANGVIDFDATSYINGSAPRYIGHPRNLTNSNKYSKGLPPQANMSNSIQDEFVRKTKNIPSWKKILTGALLIGATVFAATKIKPLGKLIAKPIVWIKNKIKIKKP